MISIYEVLLDELLQNEPLLDLTTNREYETELKPSPWCRESDLAIHLHSFAPLTLTHETVLSTEAPGAAFNPSVITEAAPGQTLVLNDRDEAHPP